MMDRIQKKQKKKEVSYDLILIPDGTQPMRKVRISGRQVRWLAGAFVVTAFFLIFNAAGFLYYRSLYASLERDRLKVLAYEQEKRNLIGKVSTLERTVDSTEKLVGKLAGMVGTERVPLQRGVGGLLPSEKMNIASITAPLSLSSLDAKLDHLTDRAETLESTIKGLYKIQEDRLIYISSTPSIWPLKGWVTSEFGLRRSPFTRGRDFHDGIDIAAQWGTPVVAAADGVVTYAGYKGGLGKAVIIDHGFGIKSYYGHTSEVFVHEGQKISRGAMVAHVGSTGHSTGPHLHYEIHVDGIAVDPMRYILQ